MSFAAAKHLGFLWSNNEGFQGQERRLHSDLTPDAKAMAKFLDGQNHDPAGDDNDAPHVVDGKSNQKGEEDKDVCSVAIWRLL